MFVSIPSQSRHIEPIRAKCKKLGFLVIKEDLQIVREGNSNTVDVFPHQEGLWNYIMSLEPVYEKKIVKTIIENPTALQVVRLGYPSTPGVK